MKTKKLIAVAAIYSAQLLAYSLEDYLKESESNDPSLKAAVFEQQAYELAMRRSEEVTSLKFFTESRFVDDSRPVLNPSFQGNRSTEFSLGVGLSQQTPIGVNWMLSQNFRQTKIFGVNPGLLPLTEYYDFFPMAEVTLPLWRNFLGAEVRAQRDSIQSLSELDNIQAKIEKESKLVDIERAFYCYGIQKNLLELAQKNLDRSDKFYRSISNRRQKNLVDESDELQARAALSLRRLEFDRAQRETRVCRALFNSYRGAPETQETPTLALKLIEPQTLRDFTKTKKLSLFEKAKSLQLKGRINQARAGVEAATPKLDLKGTATLQGRDNNSYSQSFQNMSNEKRNLWSIGISFQTPLDITLARDAQKAASFLEKASEERLKRSVVDQDLSWVREQEDLLRCAQSLELLRDLEKSQRKRFAAEEKKYKNGRSTLFLVLSAEQDLINSESQNWSNELQCRVIQAQTRLFSEEG